MDQDVVQALFSAFIVIATMLLVGFPVHEGLHAWTAMKLGDNTARFMGRVTLDPRAHFDQFGGLIPGVICATICYFLSAPVIRVYQNRRKGRLKAKFEELRARREAKKMGQESD